MVTKGELQKIGKEHQARIEQLKLIKQKTTEEQVKAEKIRILGQIKHRLIDELKARALKHNFMQVYAASIDDEYEFSNAIKKTILDASYQENDIDLAERGKERLEIRRAFEEGIITPKFVKEHMWPTGNFFRIHQLCTDLDLEPLIEFTEPAPNPHPVESKPTYVNGLAIVIRW